MDTETKEFDFDLGIGFDSDDLTGLPAFPDCLPPAVSTRCRQHLAWPPQHSLQAAVRVLVPDRACGRQGLTAHQHACNSMHANLQVAAQA